jgi:Na+/glutamate symporter
MILELNNLYVEIFMEMPALLILDANLIYASFYYFFYLLSKLTEKYNNRQFFHCSTHQNKQL